MTNTPVNGRYPCVCCGYRTLDEPTGNSFLICPVCYWEDDGVQSDDPTYDGGANVPSLLEAKQNFKRWGAVEKRFVPNVRPPFKDEI